MKEAEARGAASQIKPEMPRGLQALITTAPIKSGLDANQRRQTGSVGRRWPSEFVRAGRTDESAAARRWIVTATGPSGIFLQSEAFVTLLNGSG